MGFDDIVPIIGNLGRYQLLIFILISYLNIMHGTIAVYNVFFQAIPDHRCQLSSENSSSAYYLPDAEMKENYPIDPVTETYSMCYMFDDNNKTVSCKNIIFDDSIYKTTTITEWKMVCSRAFMDPLATAFFMVGYLIGSLVSGQLSDRFGRWLTLCVNTTIQVLVGILTAVNNSYYALFFIVRILMGAALAGGILVGFVLISELVGNKYRVYAGLLCHFSFSVGYMLVAPYAYFIRYWQRLVGLVAGLGGVCIAYWLIIPESPRWLLSQNKMVKAEKVIKKIAKYNNKVLGDEDIKKFLADEIKKNEAQEPAQATTEPAEEPQTPKRKANVFDMCKYPKMRRRTCILFLDWFSLTSSYYGLSWGSSNLGGNPFINLFLGGLVEIPANIILSLFLNRWGRKLIICGSMFFGGVFLILIAAVPKKMEWLIIIFAMIGKFTVTIAFNGIYIWTVELYPTVIRNSALGASSMMARFGSILAPFINQTTVFWKPTNNVIYGILIFVASIISLTLPETLKRKLSDTLEEGENI